MFGREGVFDIPGEFHPILLMNLGADRLNQNFNLIALKDSQAVERLTRVTVLLAKVTILFLPVSLMTGYFSTELVEVKGVYTINQYWVSFGVIVFLSFVLLVVFGVASDTVEGKTIYASLFRTFFRFSRHRMSRPGREGVERS